MKKNNITQAELVKKCEELGYIISQSTVSKITTGQGTKPTLINLAYICRALEIDIYSVLWEEVSDDEKILSPCLETKGESYLSFDSTKKQFQGYPGKYFCYFYPTISSEHKLLCGELTFKENELDNTCTAIFKLDTGKKDINSDPLTKDYVGKLVISEHLGACYCILTNSNKIGEICFLIFKHMYFTHGSLLCRVAAVVTSSAGRNKRPTLHRMIISQNEIEEDDLEILKGQLLLNDSDILIPEYRLKYLKEDLSKYFKKEQTDSTLKLLENSLKNYYCLPEASIRYLSDFSITSLEKYKIICILRNHSICNRYNKVSSKSDDIVFNILEFAANSMKKENLSDKHNSNILNQKAQDEI